MSLVSRRFWKYVNKNGPIHPVCGQCWLWTASTVDGGYGAFTIRRRIIRAHRWSYAQAVGPPGEMDVLHRCDTPPCVNPSHLFLGTAQDNADDKVSKGRQMKGEESPNARVTEEIVKEIRRLYALRRRVKDRTYGQRALARKFNIAQPTVHDIVHRISWKHI